VSDPHSAIIGLKAELKTVRAKARMLEDENRRWRKVCTTLRSIAGLDPSNFTNLLRAESLTD
jgi:hypothetical protein